MWSLRYANSDKTGLLTDLMYSDSQSPNARAFQQTSEKKEHESDKTNNRTGPV